MNCKFDVKDLVIFTKIVSSGLLIVGFILLGYYAGLYFENKYDLAQSTPVWGALIGAVLGLLQCWKMIKSIVDQLRGDSK